VSVNSELLRITIYGDYCIALPIGMKPERVDG
jgi:hypothetical protein